MSMTLLAVTCLGALLLLPGTPQTPANRDPSSAKLQLDVVAVDRDGMPLQDLKKDDIEVWMGAYRLPIEALTPVANGERSVVLLIDDVTLSPIGLGRMKEIARTFIARLAPGDQMAILRLSGGMAAKSTDDPAALRRAIDAFALPATMFTRADDFSAHVLTSIASIARQLGESPAPRRSIVAIGSAWLLDTPIPGGFGTRTLAAEWTAAAKAMAAVNASLYVVDPGGVGTPAPVGQKGFAYDMGGHAFINRNDLTRVADQIMRELAAYYTVTVENPPFYKGDDLREVDVRVRRRGVTVRTRHLIAGDR